ncbi:hypothetical protein MKZ38_005067 [Zalerion maritima]|uniref:Uncharacterized protein n=1 Tax=Zalerion maritima TaxID=339359 RepID=A0AAD5RKX6_9PEZI|nr:hypothetical protein MKZ38_005067 [Zalerion maritima]
MPRRPHAILHFGKREEKPTSSVPDLAKSQDSLSSIDDANDHVRTISGDASPLCDSKIFDSQLSPTTRQSPPNRKGGFYKPSSAVGSNSQAPVHLSREEESLFSQRPDALRSRVSAGIGPPVSYRKYEVYWLDLALDASTSSVRLRFGDSLFQTEVVTNTPSSSGERNEDLLLFLVASTGCLAIVLRSYAELRQQATRLWFLGEEVELNQ